MTKRDIAQTAEKNIVESTLLQYIDTEAKKKISFLEEYFIPYVMAEHMDHRLCPNREKCRWYMDTDAKMLKIEVDIKLHTYIFKSELSTYNVTASVCNAIVKYFLTKVGVKASVHYDAYGKEKYRIVVGIPTEA